jgi:hypothetical protein
VSNRLTSFVRARDQHGSLQVADDCLRRFGRGPGQYEFALRNALIEYPSEPGLVDIKESVTASCIGEGRVDVPGRQHAARAHPSLIQHIGVVAQSQRRRKTSRLVALVGGGRRRAPLRNHSDRTLGLIKYGARH